MEPISARYDSNRLLSNFISQHLCHNTCYFRGGHLVPYLYSYNLKRIQLTLCILPSCSQAEFQLLIAEAPLKEQITAHHSFRRQEWFDDVLQVQCILSRRIEYDYTDKNILIRIKHHIAGLG